MVDLCSNSPGSVPPPPWQGQFFLRVSEVALSRRRPFSLSHSHTHTLVSVAVGFCSPWNSIAFFAQLERKLDSNEDTDQPTKPPTKKPTKPPTKKPTKQPTKRPTKKPTKKPTQPTKKPTKKPTIKKPTKKPTKPTKKPTKKPTNQPVRTVYSPQPCPALPWCQTVIRTQRLGEASFSPPSNNDTLVLTPMFVAFGLVFSYAFAGGWPGLLFSSVSQDSASQDN